MVESLHKSGIQSVEDAGKIKFGPVIIRSHGIPQDILLDLKNNNFDIIDATCPYVAKAQEFAKLVDGEDYEIIILGNQNHPEIIALKSYIDSQVYFCENIETLPRKRYTKVAIICQTTQNIDNLSNLIKALIPLSLELRVFNTICNATSIRQNSSLALAKECDLMIVIGGKNSSNTLMLARLCADYCETLHIETEKELDEQWITKFKTNNSKPAKIGLTAGASTPDWIIINVYNKIKTIIKDVADLANSIEAIPGYKEEPNEY
jgi:(E)-4-hydroxy-3-methyl-but-2-enyl pyrophosphate reductase